MYVLKGFRHISAISYPTRSYFLVEATLSFLKCFFSFLSDMLTILKVKMFSVDPIINFDLVLLHSFLLFYISPISRMCANVFIFYSYLIIKVRNFRLKSFPFRILKVVVYCFQFSLLLSRMSPLPCFAPPNLSFFFLLQFYDILDIC